VGGDTSSDAVVRGGVAVELVHLGSLYHDDVMDEATTRRGVESVNARWGNWVAIVAGDFLLARASGIAADLGTEVSQVLAHTIGRLCEGQISELRTTFDTGRTQQAYFDAIAGKTASLMAASCRIGGLTAELGVGDTDRLTTFGHAFGMVFQVVDDILDVVGSEEDLGKPAGHDMEEGVYTLPVLLALAGPDGADLRDLLGRRIDAVEREEARTLVRASGAVTQAVGIGRGYADEADRVAESLGPGGHPLVGLGHRLLDTVA
jgi:heptaprenyl diphosphate synthase